MEIAEFLLARIAEDEAVATAAIARNGATWSTADLSGGTRITGATEFGNPRSYGGDAALWDDEGAMGMFTETATHVVRHGPARVLAECEAKRATLVTRDSFIAVAQAATTLQTKLTASGAVAAIDALLPYLALPYADHPDYREEWKP